MSVAGEINVVDPRTLEHGCLLSPDVWRKQEDPIHRSAGGAGSLGVGATARLRAPTSWWRRCRFSSTRVPSHTPGGLPGDDGVEQGQSSSGRANLGVRHPLPQSRPVHVKVGRGCQPGHVQESSTFSNNERRIFVNNKSRAGIVGPVRPGRCLLGRLGKMLTWVMPLSGGYGRRHDLPNASDLAVRQRSHVLPEVVQRSSPSPNCGLAGRATTFEGRSWNRCRKLCRGRCRRSPRLYQRRRPPGFGLRTG